MGETGLTERQQQILEFIDQQIRDRGYPPSVREIGEAVGLTSPSTVHSHLATGVLAHENIEESLPLPAEFTGEGDLFMLRVRGDSMVDAGILDGDRVVARVQDTADHGDLVVAGFDDEEATVKAFDRDGDVVVLEPANDAFQPIRRPASEVRIYGRVVTVLRRI